MAVMKFGNYDWIPGYFKDQDVFVCASGPSMIDQFNNDFSRLEGKKKVVISHVSKFIEPDIMTFLDASVMQALGKDFYDKPYKTVVGNNINLDPRGQLAKVRYAGEPKLDPSNGFYGQYSTGYFALNIALCTGAKNIYLIGFDCTFTKQANFYNTKEVKGYARNPHGRYERMVKGFDRFAKFKNIYNLSPISQIKVFPYKDIDDIL